MRAFVLGYEITTVFFSLNRNYFHLCQNYLDLLAFSSELLSQKIQFLPYGFQYEQSSFLQFLITRHFYWVGRLIIRLEYQTNPFPHCYTLGSLQVLCKTILTISAPHPLCKQNIYNLRSSTPSKMLTQYLNRDLFIHASSKFQVCSTPRSGRFW